MTVTVGHKLYNRGCKIFHMYLSFINLDTKSGKTKLIPTVYRTNVDNVTQLRLKTPVLSMASSNIVKQRTATASSAALSSSRKDNIRNKVKSSRLSRNRLTVVENEMTTTSPFIMSVGKRTKNKESTTTVNEVDKVIDGNAVLSNFNVDDLSDDERKDMLTNILDIIQHKTNSIESSTSSINKRGQQNKSKIKTKAIAKTHNVRIISSLDELDDLKHQKSNSISGKSGDTSKKSPIYVVLLPQDKKKKK